MIINYIYDKVNYARLDFGIFMLKNWSYTKKIKLFLHRFISLIFVIIKILINAVNCASNRIDITPS